MPRALIAGTGKMGRDVGLFLLRQGWEVIWLTRHQERRQVFGEILQKEVRRLGRVLGKEAQQFRYQCRTYGELKEISADLIVENGPEDIAVKRGLLETLKTQLSNEVLLASNSSSILPSQIHRDCVGLHFFYPLQLTNLVEVILPETLTPSREKQLITWLREWHIQTIMQNEQNAFAANRLLLPLQAEVFRLLHEGVPPALIDSCSQSAFMPIGHLSFMDSIGLDILNTAVRNYAQRMPSVEQKDYVQLIESLAVLVGMGKWGKKNKNGLLAGEALPWPEKKETPILAESIKNCLQHLFINTCIRFLESKQLTTQDLNILLSSVYNGGVNWNNFETGLDKSQLKEKLQDCHLKSGRSYYAPVMSI
jgi:3-hydroxyacyl-CoA dehydrogenase